MAAHRHRTGPDIAAGRTCSCQPVGHAGHPSLLRGTVEVQGFMGGIVYMQRSRKETVAVIPW
ncbi:MAG: hypothetical protein R3A10_09535 [Caldilineaceae bacterium]